MYVCVCVCQTHRHRQQYGVSQKKKGWGQVKVGNDGGQIGTKRAFIWGDGYTMQCAGDDLWS